MKWHRTAKRIGLRPPERLPTKGANPDPVAAREQYDWITPPPRGTALSLGIRTADANPTIFSGHRMADFRKSSREAAPPSTNGGSGFPLCDSSRLPVSSRADVILESQIPGKPTGGIRLPGKGLCPYENGGHDTVPGAGRRRADGARPRGVRHPREGTRGAAKGCRTLSRLRSAGLIRHTAGKRDLAREGPVEAGRNNGRHRRGDGSHAHDQQKRHGCAAAGHLERHGRHHPAPLRPGCPGAAVPECAARSAPHTGSPGQRRSSGRPTVGTVSRSAFTSRCGKSSARWPRPVPYAYRQRRPSPRRCADRDVSRVESGRIENEAEGGFPAEITRRRGEHRQREPTKGTPNEGGIRSGTHIHAHRPGPLLLRKCVNARKGPKGGPTSYTRMRPPSYPVTTKHIPDSCSHRQFPTKGRPLDRPPTRQKKEGVHQPDRPGPRADGRRSPHDDRSAWPTAPTGFPATTLRPVHSPWVSSAMDAAPFGGATETRSAPRHAPRLPPSPKSRLPQPR